MHHSREAQLGKDHSYSVGGSLIASLKTKHHHLGCRAMCHQQREDGERGWTLAAQGEGLLQHRGVERHGPIVCQVQPRQAGEFAQDPSLQQ